MKAEAWRPYCGVSMGLVPGQSPSWVAAGDPAPTPVVDVFTPLVRMGSGDPLKNRLKEVIQRRLPLFPWETEIVEYPGETPRTPSGSPSGAAELGQSPEATPTTDEHTPGDGRPPSIEIPPLPPSQA